MISKISPILLSVSISVSKDLQFKKGFNESKDILLLVKSSLSSFILDLNVLVSNVVMLFSERSNVWRLFNSLKAFLLTFPIWLLWSSILYRCLYPLVKNMYDGRVLILLKPQFIVKVFSSPGGIVFKLLPTLEMWGATSDDWDSTLLSFAVVESCSSIVIGVHLKIKNLFRLVGSSITNYELFLILVVILSKTNIHEQYHRFKRRPEYEVINVSIKWSAIY